MRQVDFKRRHTEFLRLVLERAERNSTRVVYVRGNHDDLIRHILPIGLGNVELADEHIHFGERGKYLVIHGDIFDVVTRNHRGLAVLGDIGYQHLLVEPAV